jgi:hypothetical protein
LSLLLAAEDGDATQNLTYTLLSVSPSSSNDPPLFSIVAASARMARIVVARDALDYDPPTATRSWTLRVRVTDDGLPPPSSTAAPATPTSADVTVFVTLRDVSDAPTITSIELSSPSGLMDTSGGQSLLLRGTGLPLPDTLDGSIVPPVVALVDAVPGTLPAALLPFIATNCTVVARLTA